ncbi:amidase signature domain-containing protein [Aspergillus californicus]
MGSLEGSLEQPQSLDITSLQKSYAAKAITPAAIIRQVYDRIDSYADKSVWIHLVPKDEALKAAVALATNYSDQESLPPLFGVPFSVKDSIDVAGIPTTVACPSYAYTPEITAPAVQKVLDAGGILIGKTNLDQFATGLVGHRSPYGTPRCIFDSDYISGGSSSGSSVSVGSGQVSFSIGTDTAGSTRVPATLNGIVGLKPTLGTISTVGLVPACKNADCITVLARSIEDAMAAWHTMKGYDEEDVYARPSMPVLPGFPETVRFGIPPSDLLSVLSPAYTELFTQTVNGLSGPKIGFRKVDFVYKPFQAANDMLYGSSIVAQRLVAFDDYLRKHGTEQLHPVIKTIFESSSGFDAVRAYQDIFDLALYKRQAAKQFETSIDILIVPSTVTHFTVSEIEEDPIVRNKLMGSFTHFVNLLDLCAVAIPTGKWTNPNGNLMPFGITLIGQAGRDVELMNLGQRIVDYFEACPQVV